MPQNTETLNLTPSSLQRRIKKYLPREELQLFLPCPLSFSEIAKKELQEKEIGKNLNSDSDGVSLTGDWKTLYQCNLESSVATRVLLRIDEFYANSYPELFQKLKKIHWEIYLGFERNYSVSITAKESRLHHTDNIKKAFCDAITLKMGSVGQEVQFKEQAVPCFYLRLFQDRCFISLDTSGVALYKRAFKQFHGQAPLRENLAAGILQLFQPLPNLFVDPLCGSGTLGFEFLLQKLKISPGAFREFAFEKFPYFQKTIFQNLKKKSLQENTDCKVFLNDYDKSCTEGALQTADFLGLSKYVVASNKNLKDFLKNIPCQKEYLMVSNLPYGKRIADEGTLLKDLLAFTRKRKIGGPYGFLALSSLFKTHKVGLSHQISMKNGGISTLFCYTL